MIAYVAGNQLDDLVLVLEYQYIECPLVALLNPNHQFAIDTLFAHPGLPLCFRHDSIRTVW
jgi:hypothetical protein